jgi:hypothetical protein
LGLSQKYIEAKKYKDASSIILNSNLFSKFDNETLKQILEKLVDLSIQSAK